MKIWVDPKTGDVTLSPVEYLDGAVEKTKLAIRLGLILGQI